MNDDPHIVNQLYSFTAFTASRPKDPIPGDRIDSEFTEHRRAINALYAEQQRLQTPATPKANDPVNDEKDAAGWGAYSYDWAQVSWNWAEWMDGPIPSDTLAIMGITGSHWSAAFWALQADQHATDAAESAQQSQNALAAWEETGTYYLGSKSTPPTLDNSGNPLLVGAQYFDTNYNIMRVWTGANWQDVASTASTGVITEAPQNGQFFARKDLDWWVVDWSTLLGKPTTFPPTAHTHAIADTTGLQSALDAKALAADLAAETANRTSADTTLTTNLNADIANLNAEIATRAAADSTLQDSLAAKVTKTGDTMTGRLTTPTLTVSGSAPFLELNKNASGQTNLIRAYTGGSTRWDIILGDAGSETGANAGSDFRVQRWGDGSTAIDTPLTIIRSSGAVVLSASLMAGTAIYANNDLNFGLNVNVGTVTNYRMQFNTNNYLYHNRADGGFGWWTTAGGAMIFAANMDVTFGRNINANNDPNFGLRGVSGQNQLNFSTDHLLYYQSSSGRLGYSPSAGVAAMEFDGSSQQNVNFLGSVTCAQGYKPGGGSWVATSDARIKTVSGDYTVGLEQILSLVPRRFSYKGNDTPTRDLVGGPETPPETAPQIITEAPYPASPNYTAATEGTEFIGFVAQEIEDVFPEMVTKRAAYIDGEPVIDMRDVDTGPLIYALVNSVKELSARVQQLEAKP
jgi:hypothetical protein